MSIDPRDEIVNSEDLQSEDSSDEIKDLMKEYQMKLEKLRRKKKQKENQEQSKQVPSTPEKIKVTSEKSNIKPLTFELPKEKPKSDFMNKLFEASVKKEVKSIDYNERKFEFDLSNCTFIPQDVDEIDPLSSIHLRKRYIPIDQVNQVLSQVDPNLKLLKIEKFLAKTNPLNQYQEPMYTNWGLIGFIISKSEIQMSKVNTKYMKFKIGSFNNSVELVLFDKMIDKYHKLQPGDLIVVLNPSIKKFAYKTDGVSKSGFNLNIDTDSILEIGLIKYFGYCKFPNSRCSNVINSQSQELCDLHLDLKFKKSSRMELNTTVSMRSPQKRKMNSNQFIPGTHEDSNIFTNTTNRFNTNLYQKAVPSQVKRRKLLDDRANKSLEKKLMNMSSNAIVNSLNLSEKPNADKKQQILLEKRKKADLLQDLHDLSSKHSKNKSLTSSEKDKRLRVEKWQQNMSKFKHKPNGNRPVFNDDDDDDLMITK